MIKNNTIFIYGKHPVMTAILGKKRKLYQIFLTKNSEKHFAELVKKHGFEYIKYKLVDNIYLDKLVGKDVVHQGFVAEVSMIEALELTKFEEKIAKISKERRVIIPILSNITDPHNVGAIIRTAAALGMEYMIVPQKSSVINSSIVIKSSSGMVDNIKIIESNISTAILKLKKYGFDSVSLDMNGKKSISEISKSNRMLLILGSEGEGIKSNVKNMSDFVANIPISPNVESLNVSNAFAIAAWELIKI